MDIKYPEICANCGTRPSEIWMADVDAPIVKGGLIHRELVIHRSFKNKVKAISYEVPICYLCEEKLAIYGQIFKVFNMAGFAIGIAAIVGIVGDEFTVFIFMLLLSIVWLITIRILYNPNLGSYNGRYFQFRNKAYQAEFARLNPKLVKSHFDTKQTP